MKTIFAGPHGLRSGWRFLLFVVGVSVAHAALQVFVVKVLGYKPSDGITAPDFTLSDGLGFAVILLGMFLAARLERRTIGSYGLPLRAAFGARWWEGMLWGTIAVAVTMGLIMAAGGASIDGFTMHGPPLARTAIWWMVCMIVLGLYEEALFRGYPLEVLSRGIGFWPAALLLSVLFGALHFFSKPMENLTDAVSVGLIGLFMCFSLLRTGNLWFAIGFHTAFDYVALPALGAPNTGNLGKPLADHFIATRWTGPDWMTGGVRGLEASWFIFPVLAVLFLAMHFRFRSNALASAPAGETPVAPQVVA